jgi:hypothetical protein
MCKSGLIRAFRIGMRPMRSSSAERASKLAGMFYPQAALAAIAFHYGVKPVAEAGSEYLTPMFVGAISQAYGIPQEYVWRMH